LVPGFHNREICNTEFATDIATVTMLWSPVREFYCCEKSPQKGNTSLYIYPRTTLPWSKSLKNQQKLST